MNFNSKIILYCLFICIALCDHDIKKCSIFNHDLRTRPSTQTSSFSPTGHFLIHYDLEGEHAPSENDNNFNGISDYIDEVGIIADSSRYVLVDLMGFYPEVPDSDGVYDIYIQNRPSNNYGVNYQDGAISGASYIVIDEAYEPGDFFTSGINTMRLTVAHEFFHAIQRAYRPTPSNSHTYFWEMSATWIEDVIVPDGNDYLFWSDDFFQDMSQSISSTDGYSIALFGHYLSTTIDNNFDANQSQIQTSIIKEIWEKYEEQNNGNYIYDPFESIQNVLSINYNTNYSEVWLDFCSKNFFNGIYQDMDNPFYYYIDQISLSQPSFTSDPLYSNTVFNGIIVLEQASAFKAFYIYELAKIDINHSTIPHNTAFNYSVSVKSNNQDINQLIILDSSNNDNEYYVNQGDYLYLTYTSNDNTIISGDINFDTNVEILYGDANLDQIVNVVDIVLFVNFLFDEINFNQIQLLSTDVNLDQVWNVVDIVNILNIIFD